MDTLERTEGFGGWGFAIFFIVIMWFFAGGGLFGKEASENGCTRVSNCEVEKQEIIDSARTQYLIEQQASQTRETVNLNTRGIAEKIDFYEYQNLRDKLAETQNALMLANQKNYMDNEFCALHSQIQALSCQTAKVPPFYTCGTYANGCGNCCG